MNSQKTGIGKVKDLYINAGVDVAKDLYINAGSENGVLNFFDSENVMSDWKCYLFGDKNDGGIVYRPGTGHVPNIFIRWMMKICFGCTWVKE